MLAQAPLTIVTTAQHSEPNSPDNAANIYTVTLPLPPNEQMVPDQIKVVTPLNVPQPELWKNTAPVTVPVPLPGEVITTLSGIQIRLSDLDKEDGAAEKIPIYRHPLFPLVIALFEKCDQATQTSNFSGSDGFDADLKQYIHQQEKTRKPCFVDDPDLDGLMVKAIQVLRIHLLELEKVNDLCKDFCNRYITSLKGKLQSEHLLHIDGAGSDDESVGSPSSLGQISIQQVISPTMTTTTGSNNMMLQQIVGQTMNAPQIVSSGTVYQMVQTAQGLVAQPIQIQTTPAIQTQQPTVIQGSTPLSQIGVIGTTQLTAANNAVATPSLASLMQSSGLSIALDDDDDEDTKKRNKRGILPKSATQVMKTWLFQHIVHPYPTEEEKRHIATQTNLTLLQVNNWFINARRRILQPMLETSNPEQKAKKAKTPTRPAQRFWPESIANIQPQLPITHSNDNSPMSESSPPLTTMAVSLEEQSDVIFPQTTQVITADGSVLNVDSGALNLTTLQNLQHQHLLQVIQTLDSPESENRQLLNIAPRESLGVKHELSRGSSLEEEDVRSQNSEEAAG